jgi:hypothetical protein
MHNYFSKPSRANFFHSFKSVTIPQREDPRLANLAKRCESCRPMGMFRSTDEEFLLCYNGKSILSTNRWCLFYFLQSLAYMSTSTVILVQLDQ